MLSVIVQRVELLKRILNALKQERYVAAICSPKSGLSQLLNQLQVKVQFELSDSLCIKVDVAKLDLASATGFCDCFGEILCASGGIKDSKLEHLPLDDCLRRLASPPQRRAVILIDNCHRLSIDNQKRFLAETRALYTEGSTNPWLRNVLLVVGGAVNLWECEPEFTSPWNVADRIYPWEFDLSATEVREYTSSALVQKGLHLDSVAQQYLEDVTHGHVYLLQCVCAELTRENQGAHGREIIIDDIDATVEHFISEPNEYLDSLREKILRLESDFKLFLSEILNGLCYKFSRNEFYTRSLALLGVVAPREGYIRLRNDIINRYLLRSLAGQLPVPVAPTNLLMPRSIGANLRAYEVLYYLENELRNFTVSVLYAKYGNKWKKHLPKGDAWSAAEARQKVEGRDLYRGQPQFPILAYCQFPDLKELIEQNWDLFQDYFGPKDKFAETYTRLEEFRNTIAHNRFLSHRNLRDLERIHTTLRDCMAKR